MTMDGVVPCSGGLRIAQRGALLAEEAAVWLRVGDLAAVTLPDSEPIEAQRSDGVVWRRHWAGAHRLVIEFVGIALVEIDDATGTVTFDRELDPEMEQHLLFDHVLPLVLARNGGLVLHGGVISRERRGVVLVGATGAGKSTLTAFAWLKGWTVGGDDGAVLSPTDPPTVEPTYTTIRLSPTAAAMLGIDPESGSNVIGKMRIGGEHARAFRQAPVELALIAIIQPVAAGEEARFDRLTGIDAHARLFGSTFHSDLSRDRLLPDVVDGLATIVESTTVGRLSVPRGVDGLTAAEELLSAAVDGGVAGTRRMPAGDVGRSRR